jgi:hypothetical protein
MNSNPPHPSQNQQVARPLPPSIPLQIPNKRGFMQEHYAYRASLAEYPTADEILKIIDKNKHFMTSDTVEKLKTFVYACATQDAVLTNFPSMKEVVIYKIGHDIAARKLKISIPRIDAQNQIFHFVLSVLEWTADPRYLRGYQGFDRNKQNEERTFSEITQRLPAPESKSILGKL